MIKVDYSRALEFVTEQDMEAIKADVLAAKKTLVDGTGEGNDFIGWLDLPENYDKEEYARIKKAAAKIQSDSDVLLVIGIGGSYLGARATIKITLRKTNFIIKASKIKTKKKASWNPKLLSFTTSH